MMSKRVLFRSPGIRMLALAGVALVGGCGGGSGENPSGGNVVVLPGGNATPTPTPSPSPSPSGTVTAEQLEDQRSSSALAANADAAYRAGATGRGVKIALIDTGVVPTLSEFSGRIDPASADLAGTRGVSDDNGHGTLMASVALAARDGRGMHGMAYEAVLVSLNGADPSLCRGSGDCPLSGEMLIRGIDAAIAAKVRVINISASADVTHEELVAAVRRAAAAGIVTVISAGNNNGDGRQPLLLARSFADAAPGWVIIVGGHDAAGTFYFDGSNQAGSGSAAAWYITALGKSVNMTARDGSLATFNGTSPATAAVSGAVALVAQVRPNLTGAQIVTLLLANTTDAGAPGRDPVYGNGILNLAKVFAALPAAN